MCIFISMSSANAAAIWTDSCFIRSTCVWKITFHRPCSSEAHLYRAQACRINTVNVQVDVHLLSGTSEKHLYNVYCPSLPGVLLWFKECSAINWHMNNSGVCWQYKDLISILFLFFPLQNVIAWILCSQKYIESEYLEILRSKCIFFILNRLVHCYLIHFVFWRPFVFTFNAQLQLLSYRVVFGH